MTPRPDAAPASHAHADTVEGLVRRARWIAALAVVIQFGLYSPPEGPLPWPRWPTIALLAATLVAVNLVSLAARRRGIPTTRRLGTVELAVDVAVGLALVALVAFDPFSRLWPLLSVVIAEGAARRRLRGAMATWGAAAAGLVVIDVTRIVRMGLDPGFELPGTTHAIVVLFLIALILGVLTRELGETRDRTADHARVMRSLSVAVSRLSASRRVDAVVARVLAAARDLTAAERAVLLEEDAAGWRPAGADPAGAPWEQQAEAIAADCIAAGRCVVGDGLAALPLDWPAGGKVALVLVSTEPIHGPVEEALGLLANAATVALDNAHRAELEQETIRDLRELDQLKDDFIDMLSHDLRSPLTSVSGYAQLLEEQWDRLPGDTRLDFLQALRRGAERMQRLVDEILDAARSGDPGLPLVATPVDLGFVLADPIAAEVTPSGLHDLDMQLTPDGRYVIADPERLSEALQNLLANAVKYSPAGGTIHVTSQAHGAWVDLTIADEGIGLPAEGRERLFQRFGRLHRDSGIPGTGIGLYVVRTLVDMMGGRVAATDRPGGGAAFTVTLPAADAPAAPPAAATRPERSRSAAER